MRNTELQILNSALYNKDHLSTIMGFSDSLFQSADHRAIFNTMRNLYNTGQAVSMPTVVSQMEKQNNKDIAMVLIKEMIPHPLLKDSEFNLLIENLQDERDQIELRNTADYIIDAGRKNRKVNMDSVLEKLNNLRDRRYESADNCIRLRDMARDELDSHYKRSRYILTGMPSIDEKIVGLFNGQLVVLASRPKIGKSTMALTWAQKHDTLFFSLEMNRFEVYAKILSAEAGVESWKIEINKYDEPDERTRVEKAHESMRKKLKITLYDKRINHPFLINTIYSECQKRKPELVVIDYLQLIYGVKAESRNQAISEITRSLKQSAQDNEIPIVLLSQLSRDVEKTRREPVMSDLRDSGAIEADADVILFLHEKIDPETKEPVDFYPIVAGNRKGKVGRISGLYFEKEYSRFIDKTEARYDPIKQRTEYFHD